MKALTPGPGDGGDFDPATALPGGPRLLSDREVEAGSEGQSSGLQCVGTAGIVDVEESIGVVT